jgi:hypothetical protein
MSNSKPRFEQVPLEVVKKLLEKKTEDKKRESSNDVIFEPPTKKTEPYTLPQLLRERCRSELGGQNKQIDLAVVQH